LNQFCFILHVAQASDKFTNATQNKTYIDQNEQQFDL